MPLSLQVKLLRVLQEKQVRPVGTTKSVSIDVRIISATHRSLEVEMQKRQFSRRSLLSPQSRSSATPESRGPSRRHSPSGYAFPGALCCQQPKHVAGFAPEALEVLIQAPWPGNVRHLLNVVEQAVILSTTPIIPASLVQQALSTWTLPPLMMPSTTLSKNIWCGS